MQRCFALIDQITKAILTISFEPSVIMQLFRITPHTRFITDVNYPNYVDVLPFPVGARTQYVEWSWAPAERRIVATDPKLITEELRARSLLASAKRDAILQISLILSSARLSVGTGVIFQETIYIEKLREAEAVKSVPTEALHPHLYPYVQQHAESTGMTLVKAADDILFASKLAHESLLLTEGVRMKYFRLVRDAQDPDVILTILAQFGKDMFQNSLR